jgi:hypothetical protein
LRVLEGTGLGLTEDEHRVGLLEPREIPEVGRLAELVAAREGVGNENEKGELDSQDSFRGFHNGVSRFTTWDALGGAYLHSCT